jgi:hypothetical protein
MAETVNSLEWSFSVNQSTFLLVEQKMTAWVMVTVSYKSQRVSSFQSSFSTAISVGQAGTRVSQPLQGKQYATTISPRLTELPDTFQGQLLFLDQDPDGVPHELFGNVQHIVGHGGGQEHHLGLGGQELENVVHVLGESLGQHLVGLVEGKDLDVVGLQESTVDHCERASERATIMSTHRIDSPPSHYLRHLRLTVKDTSGSTDNDMRSSLQLGDILLDRSSSDTSVAIDVHVITEGDDDLLDLLGEFSGGGQDQSLGFTESHVDLARKRKKKETT